MTFFAMMPSDASVRQSLWRGWVVGLCALLITGCSSVGISRPIPAPGVAPFDQALMAYARGDLEYAADILQQPEPPDVPDLRANALLASIHRELGTPSAESNMPGESRPLVDLVTLSPESLLQIVEHQNPEIRQALFGVIATRAELREANVSFSPEFSVLTRFIPSGIFVRLTQSIIDGIVKRAERMNQAEEALIAAVANYSEVQGTVLHRAASEYIALRQTERVLHLQRSAMKVLEESMRVASLLVDHGRNPSRNRVVIRGQLLKVQDTIAKLKSRKTVAQYTLNSLMGRKGASPVRYEYKSLEVESPGEIAEVLEDVYEKHPQLVHTLANIHEARAKKDEWLWALPHVDLQGSYGAAKSRRRGGFFQGFTLGARISSPLLIWPLQKARSEREHAFIEALEMEWSRLQGDLTINVVTSYEDLRRAQDTLERIQAEKATRLQELYNLEEQERLGQARDRFDLLQARLQHLNILEQEAVQYFSIQQEMLNLRYNAGMSFQHMTFLPDSTGSDRLTLTQGEEPQNFHRGLWVWHPKFLEDREQSKFFLDFANARNIQTVFLSVSTQRLQHDAELYKRFIQQAHAHGLFVQALNGAPSWVLPSHRRLANEFIEGIVEYNQVNPDGVFDAIHLDVEPYTLPNWKTPGCSVLIGQYLDFVDWAHVKAGQAHLPLVLDVPFWFDDTPFGQRTLMEEVWPRVDDVAVMAYRSRFDHILAVIQNEVDYARKHERRMWIGVSADPRHRRTGNGVDGTSEQPWQRMVEEVESHHEGETGILGLAIHDYDRYQELLLSEPLMTL